MEPLRLHNPEVSASTILFGGLFLSLVVTIIHPPALYQQPVTFGGIVLYYSLYGGLFYAIRMGKPWATKLFLAVAPLYIIFCLANYEDILELVHRDGWMAIKDAVTFASRVLALVVLLKAPLRGAAEESGAALTE
ncbi:hypothetical protein I2I05_11660 [Hymenobacter sp. BT683]|uniref:Uncharacterized protein n=1 Tax=Hymenobacter jeongseonensis TaxID=2791027 RepID=A0ABS0II75_9BACT|nr:hypothetical protein [Hymenobacter jeongseonensis]MBF9238051.1 hypothetical protein [Hymenobacter jeongseonensis]